MYSKYETLEPVLLERLTWIEAETLPVVDMAKAVAKAILDKVLQDIEKML